MGGSNGMRKMVSTILISSLSLYQVSSWNMVTDTNANKLLGNNRNLVQNSSFVALRREDQTVTNRASFEYGKDESIFSNVTELQLVMSSEELTNTETKSSPDDLEPTTYQWLFYVDFGQAPDEMKEIKIMDETDEQLEIIDASITDKNGQDVSSNGNWRIKGKQLEFTLEKKDDSFSYLNQQVYQVTITAVASDSVRRRAQLDQIDQKLAILENELSVQGSGRTASQLGRTLEQLSGTPLLLGTKKEKFV